MKRIRKFILIALLAMTGLCVVLLAISALGNLTLPNDSGAVEVLSASDKTRLAETRRRMRGFNAGRPYL